MTLTEFLVDYASDETRNIGYEMISREIERFPTRRFANLQGSMLQTFVHPTGVISGSDFKTVKIYSEGKMSLNDKPAAERVHIGFFGLRNAGNPAL